MKYRSQESDQNSNDEDEDGLMRTLAYDTTTGTQTEFLFGDDLEAHHMRSSSNQLTTVDDLLSHISEAMYDDDDMDQYERYDDEKINRHRVADCHLSLNCYRDDDDHFVAQQPATKPAAHNQLQDRPTLGLIYYIIHTVLMTANMYAQ